MTSPRWSAALYRMIDKRGLSVSEVARSMGYRKSSPVSAWLRGVREPGIDKVLAMLDAMGADLAEFHQEMSGGAASGGIMVGSRVRHKTSGEEGVVVALEGVANISHGIGRSRMVPLSALELVAD